jgi:hypothetical protein
MNIYYPHHFLQNNNESKMVSLITSTFRSSNKNNQSLHESDIKLLLTVESFCVIVLMMSHGIKNNMYDELVIHLTSLNYIVVTVKTIKTTDDDYWLRVFTDIKAKLKNDLFVKFSIDFVLSNIIFIAHKLSCNLLITHSFLNTNNKCIFIDPLITDNVYNELILINEINYYQSNQTFTLLKNTKNPRHLAHNQIKHRDILYCIKNEPVIKSIDHRKIDDSVDCIEIKQEFDDTIIDETDSNNNYDNCVDLNDSSNGESIFLDNDFTTMETNIATLSFPAKKLSAQIPYNIDSVVKRFKNHAIINSETFVKINNIKTKTKDWQLEKQISEVSRVDHYIESLKNAYKNNNTFSEQKRDIAIIPTMTNNRSISKNNNGNPPGTKSTNISITKLNNTPEIKSNQTPSFINRIDRSNEISGTNRNMDINLIKNTMQSVKKYIKSPASSFSPIQPNVKDNIKDELKADIYIIGFSDKRYDEISKNNFNNLTTKQFTLDVDDSSKIFSSSVQSFIELDQRAKDISSLSRSIKEIIDNSTRIL